MPKGKKTNKKVEIRTEIVQMAKTKNKKKSTGGGAGGRGARDSGRMSINKTIDHNSDCFVDGIFNPFDNPGCRFPESCAQGSATMTIRYKFTFNPVAGSTSGFAAGCRVAPNLTNHVHIMQSMVTTDGGAVWSSASHPKFSAVDAEVSSYRVTSCGVRWMDYGAALGRGALVFIGTIPPLSSTAPTTPTPLSFVSSADTFSQFTVNSQLTPNEWFWQPVTTQGFIGAEDDTGTYTTSSTGLGYRAVIDACIDNNFFIFAVAPALYSDPFAAETIMTLEFIPKVAKQFLFSPEVVIGSSGAMADAFEVVKTIVKKEGFGESLLTGLSKFRSPSMPIIETKSGSKGSGKSLERKGKSGGVFGDLFKTGKQIYDGLGGAQGIATIASLLLSLPPNKTVHPLGPFRERKEPDLRDRPEPPPSLDPYPWANRNLNTPATPADVYRNSVQSEPVTPSASSSGYTVVRRV